MGKIKNSTYEELSKLIIAAIEEEQFFNKETLVPKVRAILKGFGVNLNIKNYEKVKNPTEFGKYLINIDKEHLEKNFWKGIVKKNFPEQMKVYYSQLEKLTHTDELLKQLNP